MRLGIDIGSGGNPVSFPDTRIIQYDGRCEAAPHVIGKVESLPFRTAAFDLVASSHVLEHLPRKSYQDVLSEWLRILKPLGEFWLNLPNIVWAANMISQHGVITDDVLNVLYGAQDNRYDFHMNGFTPGTLSAILESLGLEIFHYHEKSFNMIFGCRRAN